MGIIADKLKSIGSKLASPFIEKPVTRIAWQSRGKWRSFTLTPDGRIITWRYRRQPQAKVVKNVKEASEYVRDNWGIGANTRGQLPVTEAVVAPPVTSITHRAPAPRPYYPYRSCRPVRITPRAPRLRH